MLLTEITQEQHNNLTITHRTGQGKVQGQMQPSHVTGQGSSQPMNQMATPVEHKRIQAPKA
eukprot:11765568-Karenia_brevis.AAC.1